MANVKTAEKELPTEVAEETISCDDKALAQVEECVTPAAEEAKDVSEEVVPSSNSDRRGASASVTNTFMIVLVAGVVISVTLGFFLGKLGFEFLISQGVFK